jgi:CheY-like chemotaxis protein
MSSEPLLLFAEDDENDALLFSLALRKAGVLNPVAHVIDGEDAINYLSGAGKYADRLQHPLPCVLVTDLKMPKRSGFDVLAWIQNYLAAGSLPVIVLSASEQELDKKRALDLGAQAYWAKPTEFEDLVHLARELHDTWLAPHSLA